ncbi:fimbrial biogenesis outer membrane usher protein [Crinalium epipsammum PCC 9333]|uniref:Fimbrial biogenesis outer membrane usher protein n=1 Tax=Crinalium epipsammum PCC 9333 TaxID=1173022 RepID=K9VZ27_9CYAN|nr:fimbria/pilus outer membrane usher protein [Crinalium epipsammum]AFZ12410.1 fimbrial biogenesis outer membrane usher protein [Crinalium epipsammum PCC 9333]
MEHRKPLENGLIMTSTTTTLIGSSLILLFPISTLGQTLSDQSILRNAQAQPSTPTESQPQQPSPVENQPASPTPSKPSTPVPEKQDDDLFQRIFGRPRTSGSVQRVVVSFLINGEEQGQILIVLSPGGTPEVRFQAGAFLEKTAEIVRPDIQEKLRAAIDKEGNLTLEVLRQNGLEATFDQRELKLQVQVPPAQRKTNVLNVQEGNLPPGAKDALHPSRISGYVNLRGGESYVWSGKEGTSLGRQPLSLDFEGALNLNGWVIEGSTAFTEKANPNLVRGDLRVVRDAPDQALRYVAGDLSVPITGYQSSRPMVGITVARNFSLQPYRVTRPISQFEFFLERPSRVEVLINGRLTQALQLPPGRQDIRDLPLSGGINNVQLIITDDVGRVQRLDFPAPVAGELLAPGLQQFAYSLGFPTKVEKGDRNYDFTQPTLTLSHRWGLTDTLTMGGYLQADPKQQLAGVEGVWATSFGNLGWDMALSHDSDIGSDYAMRLRYDYFQTGENNPSQRTFRFALEHKGSQFTTGSGLVPRNNYSYDLSAYYSQKLFWGIGGNLSANYQLGRAEVLDTYKLSLGLSKSFKNGLGVNLNLNQSRNSAGQDEQQAYLSLFLFLPKQRQSIQATSDVRNTSSPTNRLTWNYSSPRSIGGINASVGVANTPTDYDLTGRLSYTGYRANVEFSHDFLLFRDASDATSNTTRLNWGTALVFADGHFGWSRPINNSFALVTRNENFRGQQIGINPGGSGYIARADNLGPAVVPDLQPYQVSTINIDAPNLPLGYDLGPSIYHLLPSYRSGTVIRVGTDASVFLRGVLLDAKGEPVSVQAGEVISLSDPKWKPLTLFTNKAGKFALEGLKPGRYELRLFGNQENPIRFEIPSDKTGVYDIGILKFPS